MFNATIKTSFRIALISLCAVSCSSGSKTTPEAEQLLVSAQESLQAHMPEQALHIIDSLQKTFPKDITTQRAAMHLRTLADSAMLDKEFAQVDSTIAADSVMFLQQKPQFAFVKTKDMVEGYYVIRSLQSTPLFQRTAVEPRIDEQGNVFMVSCLYGPAIKHTALSVTANGDTVKTGNVPYDGSTNYRYQDEGKSCEMVTFHADKCEELFKFVADNSESAIRLNFIGNSSTAITLSPAMAKAIADTYHFSCAMRSGKDATAKRMFLAKKRELNRKQIAKTAIK